MIDNITKGDRVQGLLVYLFGPGKGAEDHIDPRLVAGWDGMAQSGQLAEAEVFTLAAEMDRPRALHEVDVASSYVWHCSLRNHDGDRTLNDQEWARAAREVITEMGFGDCRWVAVRHADNHIHLAVTRVTEDGQLVSVSNDFRRMKPICARLEVEFGMEITPDRGRGIAGASRAELERAARAGQHETAREGLARKLRAAAAVARNETEFVTRVRQDGLVLKARRDQDGQVAGYAVSDPAADTALWYAGRTLAPDLSLPRLRQRWAGMPQPRTAPDEQAAPPGTPPPAAPPTVQASPASQPSAPADQDPSWEDTQALAPRQRLREQAWAQARAVVDDVQTRLQAVPADDVVTWAAAAGEAAGVLAVLAGRLEQPGRPGPLSRAATAMARAAQTDHMTRASRGRDLAHPPALANLWGVSRVSADALLTGSGTSSMAGLMVSVERMVDSIVEAHEARARSAYYRQATAAAQALREWASNPIGPPPADTAMVMPGYRPDPARPDPARPAAARPAEPRTPWRWRGRRDRTRDEEHGR